MGALAKLREAFTPKRQTSPEISSLASRILRTPKMTSDVASMSDADRYNALLADAKRLAASALSQDEEKG